MHRLGGSGHSLRLIKLYYAFLFILNFQLVYISLVHSRKTRSTSVFPSTVQNSSAIKNHVLNFVSRPAYRVFSKRPIAFDRLFAFIDRPAFHDRVLRLFHRSRIANYKNNSSSSPFFIYRKGYSPTRTLSRISGSLIYISVIFH